MNNNSVKNASAPVKKSDPDVENLFKNLNNLSKKLTKPKKTVMAHPFAGLKKPNVQLPKNILKPGGRINETISI